MGTIQKIGVLAGYGQFPVLLARAARARGLTVVAVAHEGETDPVFSELVSEILWVKIGQLQKSIDFFKSHDVTDVVMAGGITKENMFSNFDPDERAIALAGRLQHLSDDSFLRGIAEEYETDGVFIRPSTVFTPELTAPEGVLSQRRPTEEEEKDMDFGWRIAKALGELDVGQLAVVRNRVALALEAIDGSDETIRRGGRLGKENTVVVKVCKPGQDLRFDLPSVGLETISVMAEVKATVLVVEAEKTLIFDLEEMIEAADRAGIAVVARKDV